jgi:hypothetical protein
MWLLPKPPLSPDNLRSMEVDSVTDGSHNYPGWQPKALEAVAPTYLSAGRDSAASPRPVSLSGRPLSEAAAVA